MKFSVIVPIYKVEEYLKECVDSVLGQTYGDFELILVDDGSPDDCGSISDAYAKQDSRVKVIHKANGGLVSARQAGIKIARGEYIVNLDGDDYIDQNMLKKSAEIIDAHSPDAIYFSMMNFRGEKRWAQDECIPEGLYSEYDIRKKIYPIALLSEDMDKLNYLITVKVAKREILRPIQMAVSTFVSYGEDAACSVPLMANIKSLYVSSLPMYNYRHRGTSMSNKFNSAWFDSLNECVKGIDTMCFNIPDIDEQIDRYLTGITFAILNIVVRSKEKGAVDKLIQKIHMYNLDEYFKRAKFGRVTPKTRISYFLMRRGKYKLTYKFLKVCNFIKTSK